MISSPWFCVVDRAPKPYLVFICGSKLSCGVDVIKGASNVLSLLPEEQRESVVSQMGFLCHDDLLLSPEETRQLFDLVEDN